MRKAYKNRYINAFVFFALLILGVASLPDPAATMSQPRSLEKIALKNPVATDGDTIRDGDIRIRLWGIDAPEKSQKCLKQGEEYSCGMTAKSILSKLLYMDSVECEKVAIDRYDRIVALCKVGPFDINKGMVNMGWALDYSQYSKGYYKPDEEIAQKNKSGIWGMAFDKPSDWRKGHRRNLKGNI